MTSATPACAARPTPGRSGRSGAPSSERCPDHDEDQHAGHGELRQVGADGGPGDAEVEPVDEDDVEDDVEQVAADRGVQRCPRVLEPAEDAGGGEYDEQRRHPEPGPAQVGGGMVGDVGVALEEAHERSGQGEAGDRGHHADEDGEPDAVDALGQRSPGVAGADPPGYRGGCAIGEEDAQADRGLDHGTRDAEPRQLRCAEVADDGCVREQEERLGDQGQERRAGEAEDLPVVGAGVDALRTAGDRHRAQPTPCNDHPGVAYLT